MRTAALPLRRRTREPRGFTLLEMLVVMTLIALLLTLALPRYFHALDYGRGNVQRQNLATIRDAIDKFHGDLGRYPDSLEELVTHRYLRQVPVDPVSETSNWVVVAPQDTTQGNVYDIQPPGADTVAKEPSP
jgi:general secretion pathway protein G